MKPQTKPSPEKVLRLLSPQHAAGVREERARCQNVLRCLGLPQWWLEERHTDWISSLSLPARRGITQATPAGREQRRRWRAALWLVTVAASYGIGRLS